MLDFALIRQVGEGHSPQEYLLFLIRGGRVKVGDAKLGTPPALAAPPLAPKPEIEG